MKCAGMKYEIRANLKSVSTSTCLLDGLLSSSTSRGNSLETGTAEMICISYTNDRLCPLRES